MRLDFARHASGNYGPQVSTKSWAVHTDLNQNPAPAWIRIRDDMTPLQRFLAIIRDNGIHAIVAELERGTV